MNSLTLETRFDSLKSPDGKFVITKRGKMFLLKEFHEMYPHFPLSMLIDIEDTDVFYWCQFENRGLVLREVLSQMYLILRRYLTNVGFDDVDYLLERKDTDKKHVRV